MPTLPALEGFADFSSFSVMGVEQTCLCCQSVSHLKKSLDLLILIIIKPILSKVLPKRFVISTHAHPCLLCLSCKL